MKPLAIDLFAGLGGWAEGFLAEGYDVVGFDIERHVYGEEQYPAQLVLQDVLTLHGSQFRDATVILASPPCQAYSYRAMPFKRCKSLPPPDNSLFDACFRIQREASAAASRHIPLIVENVKGAQPWVGRARWHYGSFYLWGDVPALMPITQTVKGFGQTWFGVSHGKGFDWRQQNPRDGQQGVKVPGQKHGQEYAFTRGRKGHGGGWFTPEEERGKIGHWKESGCITRRFNSRSAARKAASAQIAKIPFPLSAYIASCYLEIPA